MPSPKASKRARKSAVVPQKRRRVASPGTATQPINVDDSQQLSQRPSPRRTLAIVASQAIKPSTPPTFESQLRESQPEAAIVEPTEGSKAATVAITEDGDNSSDEDLFDARFTDNFDGIDW